MSGVSHILVKGYRAEAATLPYTIAIPGAADGGVTTAAAATVPLLGLFADIPYAIGETADVVHVGVAKCRLGGTVTRGDRLTANASGQGVATTTQGNTYVGYALQSGVANDIIPVLLAPGVL